MNKRFDCIHYNDQYFGVSCSKEGCHELAGFRCSKYKSKFEPIQKKTPMLDKLNKMKVESDKIGDFLQWLQSKYYLIDKNESNPISNYINSSYINVEKMLAEYFDIDLIMVEKEKRDILIALKGNRCE
jgi:hypothetical protein